ncbi:MAG TPA: hypothetical protein VGR03_17600 [Candidatus Acidoferrum sp.]|nr:hypothetical protein [Candidatus Acidoferrum sp.]
MWDAFWKWLGIFGLVVGLMSGILSLFRELLGVYRPDQAHAASLFWRCVWIAFIISSVSAWASQYHRANEAERKLEETKQPSFKVTIGQSISVYRADQKATFWLPVITIVNGGAQSAILGWQIHYKSPTLDQDVPPVRILEKTFELEIPNQPVFVMNPLEAVNLKKGPIVRGDSREGRLPVFIPGDHTKEISSGEALISVTVHDYLGNSYTGEFRGEPNEGLRFLPEEGTKESLKRQKKLRD